MSVSTCFSSPDIPSFPLIRRLSLVTAGFFFFFSTPKRPKRCSPFTCRLPTVRRVRLASVVRRAVRVAIPGRYAYVAHAPDFRQFLELARESVVARAHVTPPRAPKSVGSQARSHRHVASRNIVTSLLRVMATPVGVATMYTATPRRRAAADATSRASMLSHVCWSISSAVAHAHA